MAKLRFKRTAKNAHNNAGQTQDESKVYYPLLASASIKRGFNIVSDTAGVFSAQANGISDLSKVIQSMVGKTDNRESIPSVHAQTLAFEMTLTEYPLDDESKTTVDQWRGALCMALLYPVLFPNSVTLVWRRGVLPEHNTFVDLAQHSRGSYPLELDALCVQKGDVTYPLLYCSEQCVVVPAAMALKAI